jgi:hypothetical protein
VIPLLSSPTSTPAPGLGFSEAARALRPTVSDIVWKLHCIIVNPNSKLDEVRTARRRLLRLLKTNKLQEIIVPPLALPVEPAHGVTAATKRLDSTALCEPLSRDVAKARTRVSPSARASSSQSVRTSHLTTRRGAVPSHAVRANLTITSIEEPLEVEGKSLAPAASTDSAKSVASLKVQMN